MWGWVLFLVFLIGFMLYAFAGSKLEKIMLGAFVIRSVFAIINQYIFTIPAGCCDAKRFEALAWTWAQNSPDKLVGLFDPTSSYVLSWIGAWFYMVIGRDPLFLVMTNVLISTLTVFIAYKAAKVLYSSNIAVLVAAVVAFNPSLIHYSAGYLREVYIVFGVACSIYFFMKWLIRRRFLWLFISLLMMTFSTVFHGAMFFGVLGLSLMSVGIIIKDLFQKEILRLISENQIRKGIISSLLAVIIFMTIASTINVTRLSSIGNLENFFSAEDVADVTDTAVSNRARGGAEYLAGLNIGNPFDLIWQAPIRMIYFTYSPFLWDLRSPTHLIGLLDSLIWIFMSYRIYKHRKYIFSNKNNKYLFVLLLMFLLLFSYGTSNFGTAIRHRSKFFVLLALLYPYRNESKR